MALNQVVLPPPNYYDVLNVSPRASLVEIRAAFKREVLESHPDKNPERREWSERRMRELNEAYENIGKAENRERFDRLYRAAVRFRKVRRRNKPYFFYKSDPESRALLILHHLVNRDPDAAVDVLGEMERRIGRRFLVDNLDTKDYLDSLFLLAEHHSSNHQYREAVKRLDEFYLHERHSRYRRHYYDEAVLRLKDLYLRKLPRFVPAEEVLEALSRAKLLGLSSSEERLRLWRLAEAHLKLGHLGSARSVLRAIQRTFPNAKETARIELLCAEYEAVSSAKG